MKYTAFEEIEINKEEIKKYILSQNSMDYDIDSPFEKINNFITKVDFSHLIQIELKESILFLIYYIRRTNDFSKMKAITEFIRS